MEERILKKAVLVLSFMTAGLGAFFLMGSQKLESAPQPVKYSYEEIRSPFDNKVYAVRIPDKMDFAGEAVPLNDPDVKQRIDRELLINTYWHSQTLYILKEYPQVISMVEPILARNGIPHDFVYLCVAESGLQYNAISPDGALGLWQFMKPTGQKFGLEISGEVDERLSYERSTEAACKFLLDAKQRLGSWTLAAAAFNMGLESVQQSLQKQKADNYYDLYLNRETSRYVYRILALKEVLGNPQQYGFFLQPADLYSPYNYRTIPIDSTITDLASFAKSEGTNYKMLRMLNPWIIGYSLTNKEKKTYEVNIPISE